MKKLYITGEVIKKLSKSMYSVKIENGNIKMDIEVKMSIVNRLRFLQVGYGDKVIVEINPYDLKTGKISGIVK